MAEESVKEMLWANPKAEMSDPGSMLAGDGGWWESARWKPTYKKRIYVITSPAVGYASSDGLFQLESVASKSAAKLFPCCVNGEGRVHTTSLTPLSDFPRGSDHERSSRPSNGPSKHNFKALKIGSSLNPAQVPNQYLTPTVSFLAIRLSRTQRTGRDLATFAR